MAEKLPEFFIEGQPTEEILGKGAYATVKKVSSSIAARSNDRSSCHDIYRLLWMRQNAQQK